MFLELDEQGNLGVLSLEGSTEPLLATEFSERNGEISPDGRWLAPEDLLGVTGSEARLGLNTNGHQSSAGSQIEQLAAARRPQRPRTTAPRDQPLSSSTFGNGRT